MSEGFEQDDAGGDAEVEATGRSLLRDRHPLVAQREQFRPDAVSLGAEHKEVVRAERKAC